MDRGNRPLSTGMQDILDQFEDALNDFHGAARGTDAVPTTASATEATRQRADSDCEIMTSLLRKRYAPTLEDAADGAGPAVDTPLYAAEGRHKTSPLTVENLALHDSDCHDEGARRATPMHWCCCARVI